MGIPGHKGKRVQEAQRQLHVCPECESDLVYPMEWEEAGPEHWSVILRCPNCELLEQGVFPQELVDPFDEELDRGTQALVGDLREFMRSNMAEEIDRFTGALHADAILPEDF